MTDQPMPIATSRWYGFDPACGLPVRITVGRPINVTFPYVEMLDLAPWELFRGGKYIEGIPLEDERRTYRHRLYKRQPRILAQFEELARCYPGVTAVLLCYENVWLGQPCHRLWFAEWAHEQWQWEIPELPP